MNSPHPIPSTSSTPSIPATAEAATSSEPAEVQLNSSTEVVAADSNHYFSTFRSNMERRLNERTQSWRTNLNNVFNEIRPIIQHSQSVNANANIFNNFRPNDMQSSESVPQISQAQVADSYVINLDGQSSSQQAMYYSNTSIGDRNINEHHTSSSNDPDTLIQDNARRHDRSQIQNISNIQGNTTPPPAPPHRHTNNNNSMDDVTDAFAQIPEARDMMNALMRYFPYVCIILVKTCYDLFDGILHFCSLYITFSHANYVVRQEIAKHAQRSTFKLLRELLYISIVIFVISYLMDNSIFIVSLVTANTPLAPLTLRQLLFSVGVTDLILKLITVAIKIGITLIPGSLIEYKGRVSTILVEISFRLPFLLNFTSNFDFVTGAYIFDDRSCFTVLPWTCTNSTLADLSIRLIFRIRKGKILYFFSSTNSKLKTQTSELYFLLLTRT